MEKMRVLRRSNKWTAPIGARLNDTKIMAKAKTPQLIWTIMSLSTKMKWPTRMSSKYQTLESTTTSLDYEDTQLAFKIQFY